MAFIAGYELTWAARQYRDREALVFGDRRLSFTEVNRRGNRFANALRGLGLDKNHRVAVLLNNSVESLDTVFGAAKAGVTYVALNARHTAAEQRQILEDAEPTLIVAGAEFQEVIDTATRDLPGLKAVHGVGWSHTGQDDFETLIGRADDREPGIEVEFDDLLRLHYTSGTTGRPKGILFTHRRYYQRQNNFFTALEYGLGTEDSMIHVGPLTHAAGNYLMPYYLRGARNIVMPRFDPGDMQAIIERERVSSLLLVPTMLIRLLEELDRERFDLSSVGRINYGTAPMPVDTLRQGIADFGSVFREHYGLSECPQPTTLLQPYEHVVEGPEHEVRIQNGKLSGSHRGNRLSAVVDPMGGLKGTYTDPENDSFEMDGKYKGREIKGYIRGTKKGAGWDPTFCELNLKLKPLSARVTD
ncbi:MAG TPA: AMP-binding protein [Alphaproteobacteria bacterium]|nr:AMP-binding protein [Alphaproteobacteria bacterium]